MRKFLFDELCWLRQISLSYAKCSLCCTRIKNRVIVNGFQSLLLLVRRFKQKLMPLSDSILSCWFLALSLRTCYSRLSPRTQIYIYIYNSPLSFGYFHSCFYCYCLYVDVIILQVYVICDIFIETWLLIICVCAESYETRSYSAFAT